MTSSLKHVGHAVYQATTVVALHAERSRVIAWIILPTEAPALQEFFRAMCGTIRVALEEGAQAQCLYELLTRSWPRSSSAIVAGWSPVGG